MNNEELELEIEERFNKLPRWKKIEKILANAYNIRYLKNPEEDIKEIAVSTNPFSIQYIDNPSQELIDLAINTNPHSLKYINYPSDELQLRALENCWNSDFYYVITNIFSRDNEEHFHHEVNKMKLKYGPMK